MLFGIIMSAYLQFGYLNGRVYKQDIYQYKNYYTIDNTFREQSPFYGEFGVHFERPFYVKGYKLSPFIDTSIDTLMVPEKLTNWCPTQVIFQIGAGIKITDFCTIGIEHTCYHPISTYSYVEGYELTDSYEGGTNNLYIRFEINNYGK